MLALPVPPIPTLKAFPLVVSEGQAILFKFYRDQAIQDGMTYRNELYGLVREFAISDRLRAYQHGCELFEQGIPTLISVSKHRYAIWVSLRH